MVHEHDEIIRTIRMEQRVANSLNNPIKYNETTAYKKLNKKQKQEFEIYANKKGKTKHLLVVLALLFYVTFGIFYLRFTGNVVKEIIGVTTFSFLGGILDLLFVLVTLCIIVMFLVDFTKEIRFRKRFNIKKYL